MGKCETILMFSVSKVKASGRFRNSSVVLKHSGEFKLFLACIFLLNLLQTSSSGARLKRRISNTPWLLGASHQSWDVREKLPARHAGGLKPGTTALIPACDPGGQKPGDQSRTPAVSEAHPEPAAPRRPGEDPRVLQSSLHLSRI